MPVLLETRAHMRELQYEVQGPVSERRDHIDFRIPIQPLQVSDFAIRISTMMSIRGIPGRGYVEWRGMDFVPIAL